jgi:hypothetical protein
MAHINLTKTALGSGRLLLSEDGQVVTNGHWACKRALLKQGPMLVSVEAAQALFPKADVSTIKDDHYKQIVPRYPEPMEYTKTQWVSVGTGYDSCESQLFIGEDGTSQLWIDRKYVKLFDLETVTSSATPGKCCLDPCMVDHADDWSFIVMPTRCDYQEGLK